MKIVLVFAAVCFITLSSAFPVSTELSELMRSENFLFRLFIHEEKRKHENVLFSQIEEEHEREKRSSSGEVSNSHIASCRRHHHASLQLARYFSRKLFFYFGI